ncbi:hypothetical protein L1987_44153 [Smallanthus sonchifolius]|uniref:Uncharacterized protein n=1 Tax=Smallanthus sonchifolius TaxID=185202 RepID=A0ACB9GNN1_9ASTR|nr:hypothetical protein L1987_44153 [Smallanthus sonchifolius]
MTHFKIYMTWLIVLILAAHETLVIEGRQIKSIKKQDVVQDSPANGVPRTRLPVAEEKATFPPGNRRSVPELVTDLRPTTPGNSPGAGHSFTEHRFDTQSGSGSSTGPGHSPGGGHSKENQVVKPNA